jgi:hypothetical protein
LCFQTSKVLSFVVDNKFEFFNFCLVIRRQAFLLCCGHVGEGMKGKREEDGKGSERGKEQGRRWEGE